jgi:S1-C subfamily serine protease
MRSLFRRAGACAPALLALGAPARSDREADAASWHIFSSPRAPRGAPWRPQPPLPAPEAPRAGAPPASVPDMIAAVLPSVIKIQGLLGERRVGGGSGFVVSAEGVCITNDHVVAGLKNMGCSELIAQFDDGRVFSLLPLTSDKEADIAVARLVAPPDAPPFTFLRFGRSGALRRGETVAVMGAPLGGSIVPAVGVLGGARFVADDESMNAVMHSRGDWELLQVDAAMSSGSSGGPIVDARGAVVGVSVLVQTTPFGVGSLSYGVASDQVAPIVQQLLQSGEVTRAAVGLNIVVVDAFVAARTLAATGVALLPPGAPAGLLVTHAAAGRPGAAAGLRDGDVIVALNGEPAVRKGDFFRALGPVYDAARTLEAIVWRPLGPGRGGETATIRIAPAPRDEGTRVMLGGASRRA